MDQIHELLNILKETPQMALWGLSIYFLFILLKIASWVGALALILKQLIKRYFDYKDMQVGQSQANQILEYFEMRKISTVNNNLLIELLGALRENSSYIHESDLRDAINKIRESKD